MIKIFNILFLFTIIAFVNSDAIAETKRDCSQYSTKTLVGLSEKMRCKKGLPPLKKNFLDSIKNVKNFESSLQIALFSDFKVLCNILF